MTQKEFMRILLLIEKSRKSSIQAFEFLEKENNLDENIRNLFVQQMKGYSAGATTVISHCYDNIEFANQSDAETAANEEEQLVKALEKEKGCCGNDYDSAIEDVIKIVRQVLRKSQYEKGEREREI